MENNKNKKPFEDRGKGNNRFVYDEVSIEGIIIIKKNDDLEKEELMEEKLQED